MSTRSNHLAKAVLTSTHNLYFEQKYEEYRNFYLKTFSCFFFFFFFFLAVKFSVYLNRRVFRNVLNLFLSIYIIFSSYDNKI